MESKRDRKRVEWPFFFISLLPADTVTVNNPPPRSVLANDLTRLLQLDSLFDLTITSTDVRERGACTGEVYSFATLICFQGGSVKAHQLIVFLRSPYFSPLIEVVSEFSPYTPGSRKR